MMVDIVSYCHAMSFGALNCLKYLHEKHHVCRELHPNDLVQCAKNGHVDCLRYVIERRRGTDVCRR